MQNISRKSTNSGPSAQRTIPLVNSWSTGNTISLFLFVCVSFSTMSGLLKLEGYATTPVAPPLLVGLFCKFQICPGHKNWSKQLVATKKLTKRGVYHVYM